MKIAFIARTTLFTVIGGDTFQVLESARHLRRLGVSVDIRLTHEPIAYSRYDLLHFFNIIRPADILFHIRKCNLPFVVSTMLVDYSEYDKHYRKGIAGLLFRVLSPEQIEYAKTIARFAMGRDKLRSPEYLWKGHRRSMLHIMKRASVLFTGSASERNRLMMEFSSDARCLSIPNGLNTEIFHCEDLPEKDEQLVICAARIEGIKNQVGLIRALNHTGYRLLIIGDPAPGQMEYYRECRKIAAPNIQFLRYVPQPVLAGYYRKAKVHVLPSWFETCGLSSLEAAAMGCNIVITDKGYTRDYFGSFASYCDPGDPVSIKDAIDKAAAMPSQPALRNMILSNFTWVHAADSLFQAYRTILASPDHRVAYANNLMYVKQQTHLFK